MIDKITARPLKPESWTASVAPSRMWRRCSTPQSARVEATGVAQTLRPIIEPISDFPECLRLFEAARKGGGGSGEKKE